MSDYLADTSAVIRLMTGQAHADWQALLEAGRVGICPPVEAEMAVTARTWADFQQLETNLRAAFAWHPVPDSAWSFVSKTQRELVRIGHHRGPSLADLLVAATAVEYRLSVLHRDNDFETIAKVHPVALCRVDEAPAA